MRTMCEKCQGKGWVRVASTTGSAPPYDRCPNCRGRAWVDDGKPKASPTLAACLITAADRRKPSRFAGLRNGDLMRVARRVTIHDVNEGLAFVAIIVGAMYLVML